MTGTRQFKYALCALVPLLGMIIIREIPISYASADYYYYERVFYDFLELGSTWGEMYFGPAPGFFTNMLPLAIISAFIEDLGRKFLFHICLYGMLTMGLIGFLARSVTRDNLAALVSAAMAILLIVMVGAENSFWNRPSHHYGSVINLLLAMALMVVGMGSRKATAWLYLVVILTVISDFLYIPMYLAMTGGVMLVHWLTGAVTFRQALLRGIVLTLPVVIGIAIHYLITPNVTPNPVWASGLSLREVLSSPAVHLKAIQFFFVEGIRLPVYWLSTLLGLIAWWHTRGNSSPAIRYFLYYFVAMQCVIWGNIYMSGLGDSAVVRYRLFAVNGACIMTAISAGVLAFHSKKSGVLPWIMLVSVFLLGFSYLVSPDKSRIQYHKKKDEGYVKLVNQVECVRNTVRENNLSAGIASYKEVNPFTVLSEGDVFLYPVEGDSVRPFNWLVSSVGLKRKYDYALVAKGVDQSYYERSRFYNKLGRVIVEDAYGEPVKSVVCDKYEILIYPQIDFGMAPGE